MGMMLRFATITGDCHEADLDVALLTTAKDAAKHAECMIISIEQHLVRLEKIGGR